jgi:transposase
MFSPVANSTLMTHLFLCSRLAVARPGPHVSGPMCATIEQQASRHHPRCGLPARPIARPGPAQARLRGWKGEYPRQHLKTYKGALQADAMPVSINCMAKMFYEAACWAHARRKFHEIHVVHASPTITEALARIAALYAIEEEIHGKPAELRREVRNAQTAPLLEALRTWMEKALHSLSTKSETAAAIRYALSRATPKMACSRSIIARQNARCVPSPSDRTNFLFVGSNCGGERAASM